MMSIEQIRQQARDENSLPEVLTELATNKDYITRQYVAANPNTPTATLLNLGAEFPRELLHNPVFNLLVLEDIDFVNKIPLPTLRSILRQQDVPDFILEQAGDRAEVEIQLSLANKITTSEKILKRLSTSRHAEVVEAANLHVNLAGELIQEYEEKGKKAIEQKLNNRSDRSNFKIECLEILAQIWPIPIFLVEYLFTSSSYEGILEKIAKSPATMPSVLDMIANCSDSRIKGNLVQNPRIPIDILRLVAKDARWMARKNLASNPQTPVDILEQLAEDSDNSVRIKVAENLNTPINILSELAKDADPAIAKNAIRNIAIQSNEYDVFLAKYSPNMYIKNSTEDEAVYNIPSATLEKIINKHPNFVAGYPNTPENLLLELSKHQKYSVRQNVAENIKTPDYILEELAYDEQSYVRFRVAENANTPLKILFKELIRNTWVNSSIAYQLSTQKDECREVDRIQDILAEESASSLENILQRLINDCGIQARVFLASRVDLPVDLLMQLAQKPEPKVQEAVAKNPNTTASSLEQLASNEEAEVRLAVAKHRHTSADVLAILADDDNPTIRASAMSNTNLSKEAIEQILCGKYAAEYPQYNPDFLTNHPDSLALVLDYYANSQCQLTRYIALLQSQVSQQILEEKTLSVSWLDRFAVAQNPNASSEVLQRLGADSNQLVRAAVKFNLSATKRGE